MDSLIQSVYIYKPKSNLLEGANKLVKQANLSIKQWSWKVILGKKVPEFLGKARNYVNKDIGVRKQHLHFKCQFMVRIQTSCQIKERNSYDFVPFHAVIEGYTFFFQQLEGYTLNRT